MSTANLTAPGSASYNSGTMTVGDGTWDAQDNTFLLPNLQGLNYATTRYNGMGARFALMPNYYNYILTHGILASITFLFLVPFAIMWMRFSVVPRQRKVRVHVYAQILTVFLTTVVFVMGYFAVGPSRSLTNPHHGIGLAIYVAILVQFLYGAWMRGRVISNEARFEIKRMIHRWLGKGIALLGFTQVGLGLALYGAPVSLYVLYAVAGFLLFLVWAVLSYQRERAIFFGRDHDGAGWQGFPEQQPGPPPDKPSGGRGKTILATVLGSLGLLALLNRFRKRRDDNRNDGRQSYHEGSDFEKESYHEDDNTELSDQKQKKPIGKRGVLGLGVLGLLGYYFGKFLGRTNKKDEAHDDETQTATNEEDDEEEDDEDDSEYQHDDRFGSQAPGSSIQDSPVGRRPRPGQPPLASQMSPQRNSEYDPTEDSNVSPPSTPSRRSNFVRNALVGVGLGALATRLFDRRKSRRQEEEEEAAEERRRRAEGRKFTGDGPYRPTRTRPELAVPDTFSDPLGDAVASRPALMSGSNASRPSVRFDQPPPPAPVFTQGQQGQLPPSTAALRYDPNRQRLSQQEGYGTEQRYMGTGGMPPPPAVPVHSSPGSSASSRRPNVGEQALAGLTGAALGTAAGAALADRNRRNDRPPPPAANAPYRGDDSRASSTQPSVEGGGPDYSLRVNTVNNGQAVQIRRVNEAGSPLRSPRPAPSPYGAYDPGRQLSAERQRLQESQARLNQVIAPAPPVPVGSMRPSVVSPTGTMQRPGVTSVASPGTVTSLGTGEVDSSVYARNRQRRRAERAQANPMQTGSGVQ